MKNATALYENIPEERVILGRLLQAESDYWRVAEVLRAEHFARLVHQQIFAAIRDVLQEGRKLSIAVLLGKLGDEYQDGEETRSTSTLLTALLRDAEEGGDLEGVDEIIDLWRHRKLIQTLEAMLKEARKPNAHSVDLVADTELRLQEITLNSQAEPLKSVHSIADRVLKKVQKTRDSGVLPGFDTSLPSLDEILGRIHPGDLGFIGARPGDGKSVLAAQIAQRAALYAPAVFFQLEMTDEDMVERMLAGQTGISVAEIESGAFDLYAYDELKAARDRMANSQVYIDDRPKLRIDQIWDRCRQAKRTKGLGLAVVDHIRLVRTNGKFSNRFDRVEYVTGELKAMAKEIGIAVICLSQVTRASQRRDEPLPTLNDFDGGSAIEQDADWAVGLFRRDRWLKQHRPHDPESQDFRKWADDMARWKGRIEMISLKGRRIEDGEKREAIFDGRRGLIREIDSGF